MKSILYGIVIMIAISAAAGGILSDLERSSSHAFVSPNGSVRLSE